MTFADFNRLLLRELKAVAAHFITKESLQLLDEVSNTKASYASALSQRGVQIPVQDCNEFVSDFRAKWKLDAKKPERVSNKLKRKAIQSVEEVPVQKNHRQIELYKELLAKANLDSCNVLWKDAGEAAASEWAEVNSGKRVRSRRVLVDGIAAVLRA